MPRFTIHDQTGQETDLTSELYDNLFNVLRTAGIPEDNGVVNYLHTYARSRHTLTDGIAVFHDEPFVELTCEYHYIPDILEAMVKLKVFPDLEIPLLNSFFVLGEEQKNGEWEGKLRKRLLLKSFTARNANVFRLDNLKLFMSKCTMDSNYKKTILRNALSISTVDDTIPITALSSKILLQDERDFLQALISDILHLAILAEIG